MTRIPPITGSVALRRSFVGRTSAGWLELVARAATPQRRLSERDLRDSRIQKGGTPGFSSLGLRGLIARRGVRFSAGMENLFDRGYREHGSGIDAPGRHGWIRVDLGTKD